MQKIISRLSAEAERLRAAKGSGRDYPRIVIPGVAPPVVLQNLAEPGRAVLIHGRRQPTTWPEVFWLAAQSDGGYLAVLDGEVKMIRSRDGRVETGEYDRTKWTLVGRVEREESKGASTSP